MIGQKDNLIRLDPSRRPPEASALETLARAAMSSCAGRVVTDAEWAGARYDLLQLAGLLWSWEQRAQLRQQEGSEPQQQPKAA